MGINKDPDGRRWVQAEVEVPGTPEDVWNAIATGPGISSWFVPSEVEERTGGKAVSHFAPGGAMDSLATIREWDPPHRYMAESQDEGPESPLIATEWIVEAREGGACVVRVVHSWYSDDDKWDSLFEQHEQGWTSFFRILRLYLERFADQAGVCVQVMGACDGTKEEVWARFTGMLGTGALDAGKQVASDSDATEFAGAVVWGGNDAYGEEALLHLSAPAPGIAHMFALLMGGQVFIPVRLYLFGPDAQEVARRIEPAWQAWMQEHFPMPG